MFLNGILHHTFYIIHHFFERLLTVSCEMRFKITCNVHFSIFICEVMSRLYTEHSFKKGLIRRNKLERKIVSKCLFIEHLIKLRMLHKCFDFRSKHQCTIHIRIIQWFDSENISCCKQSFLLCIPDCKSIHSAKTVYQLLTPLFVSMNQCL